MSRLVLGGAPFGKLPQTEVDDLLRTAFECGIGEIDTASGYGDSEKRIGSFLKGRTIFRINSKVGLPDPTTFTPLGIRASVEKSLNDLGIEQIGTLFIHSLDKIFFTDENISALVKLKLEGKIENIGYSGDGENLDAAIQINSFDDFMMTFNIIDQANSRIIREISSKRGTYIKIPLAQGIWKSLNFDRRIASTRIMRKLFNKPPLPDSWLDYRERLLKFRSQMMRKDFAGEFLKFALYFGEATQHVVLGTNSSEHIRDAVRVESQGTDWKHVSHYVSLWNEKSGSDWEAHN